MGGGEDGRKYLLTSFILLYLPRRSYSSEIWEVTRKLPGSRQEVLSQLLPDSQYVPHRTYTRYVLEQILTTPSDPLFTKKGRWTRDRCLLLESRIRSSDVEVGNGSTSSRCLMSNISLKDVCLGL